MVYYKRLKSVIYPFFISIMALLTIGLFFSGCSTEKTASDPSAPRSEPGAPEWVAATDGEYSNKIAITWQGVPTAETYGVYRSTAFNGTYTKIAEKLTGTSYEDNAVAADTHYFYKVEGCNGLYDPAVSAYDTGFAGNYPVISDATLGAHMKSILAKVLLKVYTGDVVLYMFPITVHGIIGGTAVASIKLAYEDGPLIITIVFTQYNDYGYAINGTIVQNLSFIGLDGTATGTLTVSGADTTTVEYHVAITSDGESHPKENGGYYILTTGSGSPQWIDWTNPDVLAANEQLYYQEVLRPIILDVWAQ
ncbi:MAG: hypothetical protein GY754_41945, partial [bacterium]|nr:hypothetical protein [bacterium]